LFKQERGKDWLLRPVEFNQDEQNECDDEEAEGDNNGRGREWKFIVVLV